MLGWIIFTVYLVGFLVTTRYAAVRWLHGEIDLRSGLRSGNNLDVLDKLLATFLGMLIATVWPFIGLALIMTMRLPKSPKQREREFTERAHEAELREIRIHRREHELGLDKE